MKTIFSTVRLLMLSALLGLVGCAGLSQNDLVQISVGSPDINMMMETLAEESGTYIQSYSAEQAALVMPRKKVSIDRFRPMLRLTCEQVYKGELQTLGKTQLLVGMNVPASRVQQLAGRKGPVVDYLGNALERSMTGYVVEQHRKVGDAISAENPGLARLIPISKAVCVSYKQGLIDIHFSAVMFSEEPKKGKADTFWTITNNQAYVAGLNKEIKRARIAAEKAMWSEKEMVDHYVGATRSQDVLVSLKLRKEQGYNEDYWLSYVFTNDGSHPYLFNVGKVDNFQTADDKRFTFKFKTVPSYGKRGSCQYDRVAQAFTVGSGVECEVKLKAEIPDLGAPDMPLSMTKGTLSIQLQPVSVYESKHELTQL